MEGRRYESSLRAPFVGTDRAPLDFTPSWTDLNVGYVFSKFSSSAGRKTCCTCRKPNVYVFGLSYATHLTPFNGLCAASEHVFCISARCVRFAWTGRSLVLYLGWCLFNGDHSISGLAFVILSVRRFWCIRCVFDSLLVRQWSTIWYFPDGQGRYFICKLHGAQIIRGLRSSRFNTL